MKEILLEGAYSHYESDIIEELGSQYKEALDYLTNIIVTYQPLIFDDLAEYLKDFGFQDGGGQSIYKTLIFKPKDKVLIKAHKKIPLGISFSIAIQPKEFIRKATYQRGMGLIDLNIGLIEDDVNEYNLMLIEARNIAPTLASYNKLQKLQELRERILYYIDPYLLKSTLVHEMTHWLDNVYDNNIFDATYDTAKWIWIKSEINSILHQAKYLFYVAKEEFLNELTIVDVLVLIRIRRDFLGKIMLEYSKKKEGSWISDFIELLENEGLKVDNLRRQDDFSNYYKMDLLGDSNAYKDYYYFLRRNIF